MIPITMAEIDETVYIQKITGKDKVRQHLAELGLVVGEPVKLLSKINGNVIISVKDGRIALDGELANRIMI